MSSVLQMSWHHNRDVPETTSQTSQMHFVEKAKLAGMLTCAIFYGVVIILFFQCMSALLGPANRTKRGTKWLLVAHTVAIFLFATVYTAIYLHIVSVSYIDNREASGATDPPRPPGPLGYQYLIYSMPINIAPTLMFLLNNLLVDGLLLYRCYVMYAMNFWVIIFPCILYLATIAMGIALLYYQISQPICTVWKSTINVGVPYSISVSLDVLLTLMIIARLVLMSREIRNAMNAPFRISRLYKAVITILSESSALYAVTFLIWIGTWAANSPLQYFFFPLLAETQVIAPFLITIQVANRRALTGDGVVSGDFGSIPSIRVRSMSVGGAPSEHSARLAGTGGKTPGDLGIKVETRIDLHHDKI